MVVNDDVVDLDMRDRGHHDGYMASEVVSIHIAEVAGPMNVTPNGATTSNVDSCTRGYDRDWG